MAADFGLKVEGLREIQQALKALGEETIEGYLVQARKH